MHAHITHYTHTPHNALVSRPANQTSYITDHTHACTLVSRSSNQTLPFKVADFLRKHKVSTQQFGTAWGNHRHEKKLRVSNVSYKTPADFMAAMEKDYNMQPVQIIGLEAIV